VGFNAERRILIDPEEHVHNNYIQLAKEDDVAAEQLAAFLEVNEATFCTHAVQIW
jgi:hypothetical protein